MLVHSVLFVNTTIVLKLALFVLEHITAHKQQKPYSAIVNHLRLRIGITLVNAAHHCLRGSRKQRHQAAPTSTPDQPLEPIPDFRML
jgi:hypothetical protein